MLPLLSGGQKEANRPADDSSFIEHLQDPELIPMLLLARYVGLLGMDVETLARNARVCFEGHDDIANAR
ncbi:MAG: hypothetical protein V4542_13960 [Pseudomonadota bacterium]